LQPNFVDDEHAVLIVRLPGNASIAEQSAAADLVREVVDRNPVPGFEVLATGPPVLLQEINDYLQKGMATLGLFAAIVMAVILFTIFRARWRLLSLGVVVIGLVWAFGLLGYLGIPLSMVTISGLPILLGLGVDFAVQTHNRFEETVAAGGDGEAAVRAVTRRIAGVLTVAMVGAVLGVLALQLSQVPMIDDFSVMLAVGVAVLVLEAVAVTTGLLLWRERRWPSRPHTAANTVVERGVLRMTSLGARWAVPLVVVGVGVGVTGLALEGSTPIQTDPEAWVGTDADSVQELEQLRAGTGYSSELDLLVEADDVMSTEVVSWIDGYVREQLERHPDELVSGASFAGIASAVTGATPAAEDVDTLLPIAPADVVTSFVTPDRRQAAIILPIANLSLQDREALLDELVADIDAPEGVTVTPAGLAVVGIELVAALEANRSAITLLALGLVAAWLLLVYRRPGRALLPLVPVVFAVGASSLAIRLLGLELTPLTTVSAPLAIAITTEFSVLLAAGFHQELGRGVGADAAVARAARRIGGAFVASGLTLLGGFVVLALAPMPLLVDFGVIVGIDVALALVTVLVVLPPLLRRSAGPVPASADVGDEVLDLTQEEGRV
jgi:hydrophobe/amphiphile efflux-3 (HAE3) family protein